MLDTLRRGYVQLITSGTQLVLLLIGFRLESRVGWLVCLLLMAGLSIMTWLSALNRLRTVRDTPTSKVASAAQGYVELYGWGLAFGETPLLSKLSLRPCLWFRYQIEQRSSENEWNIIDRGESWDSFILRDNTGECLIDPEHAEIITQHRKQWKKSDYRYTEWNLFAHDTLYVVGYFHTQGGNTIEFNSRDELSAVLAEWKQDMPALLARFDLDKDGELNLQEWTLARAAAKREVGKRLREVQATPDLNFICKPRDGKLYIISNLIQDDLSRRYLLWSWLHLLILMGALVSIGWLLHTPISELGLKP